MRTLNPDADSNPVALSEIAKLIASREKFSLVDQDEWAQKTPPGRIAIPFPERASFYWGPPPDDATAIGECERLGKPERVTSCSAGPPFGGRIIMLHFTNTRAKTRPAWLEANLLKCKNL